MRQAIAGTACHIFKVGGTAANHRPQRDHRVIFTGFRQCASRQRQLIRAWNPNDGDVFIFYLTNAFQGVNRAFQQAVIDKVVETRNGDGDASVRGSNVSFNNVHTLPSGSCAPQGGRILSYYSERCFLIIRKASRSG
ncbi:Uncharacterised protein [Acinetobacter baumannii]|nr:Uncharacterised protein [Acinetobacter baumannii]